LKGNLRMPSMPTLAYFGINSSGLNLAIDLLILFLAILYVSLIYWTYADARRRILDPMLVGCSVFVSLFPFVGTIVYIILRPPEYLEDVRERELEVQAAEVRLQQLDQMLCPHCDHHVERDFLRCPSCLRKLKDPCVNCKRPLEPTWSICPYCEADVAGVASPKRSRARRERTGAEAAAAPNSQRPPPTSRPPAPASAPRPTSTSPPAPARRGRVVIESEAQTDEGEALEGSLLDEQPLLSKPGAPARSASRASRPRTDS
jgi:hypothetical protein